MNENKLKNITIHEILKQPICYNDSIKVNKGYIKWPQLLNYNVKIEDLIDENGNMCNVNLLKNRYNLKSIIAIFFARM